MRQDESTKHGSRDDRLRHAMSLHQSGNIAAAAQAYRDLIRDDQRNFHALHYLGVIEAAQGRHQEAIRLMERSLAIMPINIDSLANYANLLAMTGRYAEGLAAFEKASALQANNADSSMAGLSAAFGSVASRRRSHLSIGSFRCSPAISLP